MKTPLKLNPLSYFLVLLGATFGLCLAALLIAFFQAPQIGTLPPGFSFNEVYWSEPWSFHTGKYRVDLPDKAVIAPVYCENGFMGMTFQAEGGTVVFPGSTRKQKVSGGFMAMDNDTFLRAKGEVLFTPLQDQTMKNRRILLARQLLVFPSLQAFVHERFFIPAEEEGYAYLENAGQARETGQQIVLENRPWLISYFGLQFLVALLFTQMLTLDLPVPKTISRTLESSPSGREFAVSAGGLLALFAVHLLADLPASVLDPALQAPSLLAYLLILLILAGLSWKQVIARQYLGLTWKNAGRGIVIALVLVLILTVFSALSFPVGLSTESLPQTARLFAILCAVAFSKEVFWRGFLQTLLERTAGRWGGLLLNSLLVTSFYLLLAWTRSAAILSDPASQLELLLFLPTSSLILGYVFLRSRNIISSTLLHALLLFIPLAIRF